MNHDQLVLPDPPASLFGSIFWMFSVQQQAGLHIERSRELLDEQDCRVAFAPLDITDVSPVDAGTIGIVFLAPAFG